MVWTEQNNRLETTLTFQDFTQAWACLTEIAFAAEKQNHHPTWKNCYNKVEISLNTHDAGDTVTEKDHRLARTIEQIFKKY